MKDIDRARHRAVGHETYKAWTDNCADELDGGVYGNHVSDKAVVEPDPVPQPVWPVERLLPGTSIVLGAE